jgi:hypothetical protein
VARMEYTSQREEAEMDMKTIEEPPRYEESWVGIFRVFLTLCLSFKPWFANYCLQTNPLVFIKRGFVHCEMNDSSQCHVARGLKFLTIIYLKWADLSTIKLLCCKFLVEDVTS